MAQMNEDELRAITDNEMRTAVGFWSGKLANQRKKALIYYLGLPEDDLAPPEIDGRSSVVSPDVRNTIESMLPQLMYKFSGSEKVVEFEPTKQQDEQKAIQATDYINWLYHSKNDGVKITYTWIKDALLSKNGILKVWWDTRNEETREEYRALNDVELAQVMDDDEVEVTEQKTYPDEEDIEQRQKAIEQLTKQLAQAQQAAMQNPQAAQAVQQITAQLQQIQSTPPAMLYDITCKRVKTSGKVCVENVPPEEFLISRKAKAIKDSPFVGHRVSRTMSELKSMGYKNVDALTSDDSSASFSLEGIERKLWDDEMAYVNNDNATNLDKSQRTIWVTECYLRVDYDGDGIAELRKVVRAGNMILDNEVVDVIPFVSITPVPLPHRFFGMSVADLALESQKTKTSILRSQLDNMYLTVNGRYFAVDGQVNLDDLMSSRPGGIVRMKQPNMAGRLDQGMGDNTNAQYMMEYMHTFLEDSTGWSRNSAGTDPNALDQTATAANIVTNKADMRVDLIARNFAEGFCDLFRLMLKLVCQYQDKESTIRLNGQWVPIDPREWHNQFDTTINVGLGNGNRDQQMAHLNVMMNHQGAGLQIGIATPENMYESSKEMTKLLGFKNGDRFFTKPGPPQPQPNPDQIKAQSQMQIEQFKAQNDAQKFQAEQQFKAQAEQAQREHEAQLEQMRMRMQAEVDRARDQGQAAQKTLELQQQAQLKQLEAEYSSRQNSEKLALEKYKADLDAQTKMAIAEMGAVAPVDTAGISTSIKELMDHINAPAEIVRGPDGRAMGIKRGDITRKLVRGPDGRATGVQ